MIPLASESILWGSPNALAVSALSSVVSLSVSCQCVSSEQSVYKIVKVTYTM
jgi:hypothetical protein